MAPYMQHPWSWYNSRLIYASIFILLPNCGNIFPNLIFEISYCKMKGLDDFKDAGMDGGVRCYLYQLCVLFHLLPPGIRCMESINDITLNHPVFQNEPFWAKTHTNMPNRCFWVVQVSLGPKYYTNRDFSVEA